MWLLLTLLAAGPVLWKIARELWRRNWPTDLIAPALAAATAGAVILEPSYGALLREAIGVASVLNALRTSLGSDPNDFAT
jgi:hypothetical protein